MSNSISVFELYERINTGNKQWEIIKDSPRGLGETNTPINSEEALS